MQRTCLEHGAWSGKPLNCTRGAGVTGADPSLGQAKSKGETILFGCEKNKTKQQ